MIAVPQMDAWPEQGNAEILPYRRLLAATLRQAVLDYANAKADLAKNSRPDVAEAFRDIHEWFFCNEEDPMSYVWICDMLRIPRNVIRDQLHLRWRELCRRTSVTYGW